MIEKILQLSGGILLGLYIYLLFIGKNGVVPKKRFLDLLVILLLI
jgi:hypothetical protein